MSYQALDRYKALEIEVRMAVSIAPMSPFDLEGGEDFVEYAERFEMYLQASKVTEGNMKRATFLSQLGAS